MIRAAWAVIAAGLWLRIWGLSFGLPIRSNLYIRPDESLIATSAVEIFSTGGRPGTFAYPALMQWAAALVYHLGGLPEEFGSDPSTCFLVLRWMSALCGAATAGVVFLLARRLGGAACGLMAALLYATAPLAVRDAHFGVTDTPYVLLAALSLLFTWRYLEASEAAERREWWRAALLVTLTAATKYAGLLMAPVLLAAVFMRCRDGNRPVPWVRLAAAAGLGAAVFLAANPYLIVLWERAYRELRSILSALYLWQPGDPAWTLSYALEQIGRPLRHGPGALWGLALALGGALWALRRRPRERPALLAVQALMSTFIVLLPFQHTIPYRYLLPALPWIAVLAAWVLARITGNRPWAMGLACLALILPGLQLTWEMNDALTRPDTRTLAGEWIRTGIPVQVPLIWAGGPECEAQFEETPASIQRRIDFAVRRYGPFSGAIVSQPYRLMEAARRRAGSGGWKVHRNPEATSEVPREVVLITAEHPLPMCNTTYRLPGEGWREVKSAVFIGFAGDGSGMEFDRIDAFFLPFRGIDKIRHPGPAIRVRWLRR